MAVPVHRRSLGFSYTNFTNLALQILARLSIYNFEIDLKKASILCHT